MIVLLKSKSSAYMGNSKAISQEAPQYYEINVIISSPFKLKTLSATVSFFISIPFFGSFLFAGRERFLERTVF